MINEFDIKDWNMLTEPLELKDLKTMDVFNIEGYTEMFINLGNKGPCIIATSVPNRQNYILPSFLKINLWQKADETKVAPTVN